MRWAYDPKLVPLARRLRNNATPGEVALWVYLKNRQIQGLDFHRQKPVDRYIIDFFEPSMALAVELDGSSHIQKNEDDKRRDSRLRQLGITVLRFQEFDARRNTGSVVSTIRNWVEKNPKATHPGVRLCLTSAPLDRGDNAGAGCLHIPSIKFAKPARVRCDFERITIPQLGAEQGQCGGAQLRGVLPFSLTSPT